MSVLRQFRNKMFFSIGLGALVAVGLVVYANHDAVIDALASFSWWFVPGVLLLATGNYLVRFLRWEYYLDVLEIERPRRVSLMIFLSGLVMSVTPGKFGEVLKSFLLKSVQGTPIAVSAPIVFAERLTDFTALIVLAAIGFSSLRIELWTLLLSLGITFFILAFLSSERLSLGWVRWMSRFSWFAGIAAKLEEAYASTRRLLGPKHLGLCTIYGVLGWTCECVAFYVVLRGFGTHLPLLSATFIYAFATIVGALTMLPGRLGPTELSMTGLLVAQDVDPGSAAAATLVVRLCTLWFAVLLGGIVLSVAQRRFSITGELPVAGAESGTGDE